MDGNNLPLETKTEVTESTQDALKLVFSKNPSLLTVGTFRDAKHIGACWDALSYQEQYIMLGFLFGELNATRDELDVRREEKGGANYE